MKKLHTRIAAVALLALTVALASCGSPADEAKVTDEQEVGKATGKELKADVMSSSVGFTGFGVGKDHPGKFKLSEGSLSIADGKVTGGKFTININSLTMDQEGEFITGKLRPHLLSADFLDSAKFATATFEITKVEPYTPNGSDSSVVAGANQTVSGNLTLKGVTKNVTFPAKIEVTENAATAAANFSIDRSQWGISYGTDASLKDKMISSNVTIRILIAAKE